MTAVTRYQRFTPDAPCPVCDGNPYLPSGRGVRCHGFLSADGAYAHCSRPEHAGLLPSGRDGLYAHRLDGCRCGQQHGERLARRPEQAPPEESESDEKRTERALRIWEATESAKGSHVERYLASRRLIGTIPPTLRWASLKHPGGGRWPCMVARVQRVGMVGTVAIHRTFLARDGVGKAPVSPAKMSLGPVGGGAVRLCDAGGQVAVTEGIETGLAVQFTTNTPTWAALSAVGMELLILPPLPLAAAVVIAADNDDRGLQAAHRARERWIAEGRKVRVVTPPERGEDFADLLAVTQ